MSQHSPHPKVRPDQLSAVTARSGCRADGCELFLLPPRHLLPLLPKGQAHPHILPYGKSAKSKGCCCEFLQTLYGALCIYSYCQLHMQALYYVTYLQNRLCIVNRNSYRCDRGCLTMHRENWAAILNVLSNEYNVTFPRIAVWWSADMIFEQWCLTFSRPVLC